MNPIYQRKGGPFKIVKLQ